MSAVAMGLPAHVGKSLAADTAPYFVSARDATTNMREGPSDKHRIKWVYHRKGLPLEVIATFDVWRRVRDMDGEIGWVHTALLSRDRTAMIVGTGDAPIRAGEAETSDIVAEGQPGAVGTLEECGDETCKVKFEQAEGWIDRTRLWGVHAGKNF